MYIQVYMMTLLETDSPWKEKKNVVIFSTSGTASGAFEIY